MRKCAQAGFNLIEMLVVIAIVGILAALMLPSLSQVRARAQRTQCVNNLHQIGLALQNFNTDYQAFPSAFAPTNSELPGRWWAQQLERGGFGISDPETNFNMRGVWWCPNAHWPNYGPGGYAAYSYNGYGSLRFGSLTNALGLFGHYDPILDQIVPISESEVLVPSDMMAIGDNFFADAFFGRVDLASSAKWNASSWHQGRANVLFCDGHVESPTFYSLYVDASDEALARWSRDHQPHRDGH